MGTSHPPIGQRLSLELQLLASCCNWPRRADLADQIHELAGQIEDWEKFDQFARRHQLQGFAQAQLREVAAVPDQLKERFAAQARRRSMANLNQAREALRLQRELEDRGIANIVLKGLPLAARLYGSLSITLSGDIDFLVRPAQALQALRSLEQQGYRTALTGKLLTDKQAATIIRHHKEVALRHDDAGLVDLHWRLVDPPQILAGIRPFENAREVDVKSLGKCKVLGEADEFAYLCAHGALSDWSHLKWLCDVHALIKKYPPERLPALVSHAYQLGAGPCAMQALAMRKLVFAEPFPKGIEPVTSKPFDDRHLTFIMDRVEQISPAQSLKGNTAQIWQQAKARRKLYARPFDAALNLRSHLFALPDMLAVPLPRGLDFLYLPLRPLLWLKRRFSPDSPMP